VTRASQQRSKRARIDFSLTCPISVCALSAAPFLLLFFLSTDVKLFAKQSETDEIIEDAAAMIGCPRSSLNGLSCWLLLLFGCCWCHEHATVPVSPSLM
jgi:hypothetical protein